MARLGFVALAFLFTVSAFAAEFPVADSVLGNAPGGRQGVSIASDGDGFLAAWIDTRAIEPVLMAARLTRDGQVLDPKGIPLFRGSAGRPQVLWNGERYLVFQAAGGTLIVTPVNRDGTAGPGRGLRQGITFDPYRGAWVATNGSRIVAVYGDADGFLGSPRRLRAGVFTLDADFIEEHILEEAEESNRYLLTRLVPSIAVNGSQFLVAWNLFPPDQQLQLNAVRLDANGTPIDTVPHVIGSAGIEAIIAANGDGYVAINPFLSWGVSSDLTKVTAPAALAVFGAPGSYERVVTSRDGRRATMFGLVNGENGMVLAASDFNDQGHAAGSASLTLPSRGAVAAGSNGSRIAVVWLSEEENPVVVFAMVDETTLQRVTDVAPLTQSAPGQSGPSVAASATETLTAWHESGGVRAARVLGNGTRLDGRGIELSDGDGNHDPSVVFDGERYVVAFTNRKGYLDEEVVVRFISPRDGLLPNAIRIPSDRAGETVALANGPDAVLLVWRGGAVRISRSMQLIGTPVQLADGVGASPVAAWNGSEYLVAWQQEQFDFDYLFYPLIAGVRLNANLTPIDTQARVLAQVPGRGVVQHEDPALAWDGTHWLLAFTSQPWGEVLHPEVWVVRLDGGPLEGTIYGRGFAPELTAAGSRVWLAWKDDHPDRTLRVITLDGTQNLFIAARTPRDFQWIERFGMTARGEQIFLAYPRISDEDGSVPRVFLRSPNPVPQPPKRRAVR